MRLTTHNLNKALIKTATTLLASGAHTATALLTPACTVRVARRAFKGRLRGTPNKGPLELVVTVGKPNYRARQVIARAIKAKTTFPVQAIHLEFLAPRKPQARVARRSR